MRLLLIFMACLPFTESQIEAVFAHGTREEQGRMTLMLTHRFYTWEPRPDNHAKHEFQTSFVEDNTSSLAICLGGTGCLDADQPVYVHGRGMVPVAEIDGPFITRSWCAKTRREVLALANRPFVKGYADLFEFRLSDGTSFRATAFHRVLAADSRWVTCEASLSGCLPLFSVSRPRSSSGTILPFQAPLGGNEPSDTAHVHIATARLLGSNRPFYDFTVHGTHCYVIDGIVHHNSGKTDAAAMKTARYLKRQIPYRERCPFWIVGEKFDQVQNVCWGEKLSTMIPQDDILDIVWKSGRMNRPRSVLLKHPTLPGKVGWVLEFKSYEQRIKSMKAESIGGFWCNEEIPFGLVIEIMGRCRDYNSPGWCDFTPLECKDQAWVDAYNDVPEGWAWYHLNTLENPYISEDWKRTFFATVPEDQRELRTIGRFTSLAGQVYKEFRKDIHVIEPFDIPRDWKRIRAIDFGFGHPFVCLWIAFGFDGRAYVYDEYWRNQTLLQDHAREIHKRTWFPSDENPYYGQTYSDHDPQVRAELSRLGIHCTPANKGVTAGIEYVRGQMIVQANGHPRLYFFGKHPGEPDGAERCRNLIREVPAYHFDPQGRHNEPVKVDDDTVDALRYGLYTSRIVPASAGSSGWRSTVDGRKYGVMAIRGGN